MQALPARILALSDSMVSPPGTPAARMGAGRH